MSGIALAGGEGFKTKSGIEARMPVATLPGAEQHGAIGQRGYDVATRKPVTPETLA
jgi:hypothetical protein